MKIINLLVLMTFILLSTGFSPTIAQDNLEVNSFAIEGSVVDNYANLTYSWEIQNDGSQDDEISIGIEVSEFLFLSNLSIIVDGITYWGQVYTIEEAEQEYQEGVESNKTAVIVTIVDDQHQVRFNIKAGSAANLVLFFEGYVRRALGEYNLQLLKNYSTNFGTVVGDFIVSIEITSSQSTVYGASLTELDSQISAITGGRQIFYQANNFDVQVLPMEYKIISSQGEGNLLTYNNGTTNFFAYFFAPEVYAVEDIVSREYVFVLDNSGSMFGDRLRNAKTAFQSLISTLTDNDYFNVLIFNSVVESVFEATMPASLENVETALSWVDSIEVAGSTNIDLALNKGFSSFLQESTAKVLVFLSDGDPTEGVTQHDEIRQNSVAYNDHEATLFSVSVGTQSAEELMGVLAYDTGGEFAKITDDVNIIEELTAFYEYFNYPVATGMQITYQNILSGPYPGIEYVYGPIFNGSEVVQVGTFTEDLNITITIYRASGEESWNNFAEFATTDNPAVERIWAIYRIQHLVRINTLSLGLDTYSDIIQLALQYQLVIPGYTAITAVAEDDNTSEDTSDQEKREFDNDLEPPDNQYDTYYDGGFAGVDAQEADTYTQVGFVVTTLALISLTRVKLRKKNKQALV